jgi:hypothetical protein
MEWNGMKIKLKRCRCGRFKAAGDRWRVLKRADIGEKSLLKCLQCGHRWHSKLKYVARLNDHVEYSRRGMTDQDILDRLNDRTLFVDHDGLFVISYSREKRELTVWERERKGTTYRFVSICHRNKKKKIAIHRLVWLSVHRTLIPHGFDVDHIKGRNVENPDGIGNLRLLPSGINRSRNTADYDDDFVTEEPF